MPQPNFAQLEQQVSERWKQLNIFERSVSQRPVDRSFVFYDGPPFATGLPHYGHIVASTIKDVVPRYATMRGYRVERRWGWDCHGLPVENLIEQELGLKTKQDIEAIGVAKFNDACRDSVLRYTKEWRSTIERLGRWVDMDNDYRTMDPTFMESVWWVFSELYKQGLIYEGKKAMHVCPRCVTPLSNFEVTLGYREVDDIAVTWKFKVLNQPNTYLLAWTTTPWSTPTTMGLSVGVQHTYVKVKVGDDYVICVKDRLATVMQNVTHYQVIDEFKGDQLVGLAYQPIVDYYRDVPEVKNNPNVYHVFAADYVEVTEGTGIVTINGSYGDIDMQAAQTNHLPMVMDVDMDGTFNQLTKPLAGLPVKRGQAKLLELVQSAGLVWRTETYRHNYPHCWRCDTPLLNYATTSWFVRVTNLKERLLKNNDLIHWLPDHIKAGRFGKWLAGAKDWAISRDRYWGAPLPIWKAADGEVICVSSMAELAELSGVTVTDLHKQYVDPIVITKDNKQFKRIPQVVDCWFESGAMPYGQQHYPFEHKAEFEANFPAQFIAEGQDQTRGWFYTLMVLSTALFDKPAFRNVIVNGLVLAEDGKKMSKRLKNYPEPELVLNKYGADALRFYLMSSPVVQAEDLRFSEKGVDLVMKKVLLTLWNIFTFYQLFARDQTPSAQPSTEHIMDRWIVSLCQQTVQQVTTAMEQYDLASATHQLESFIQELSTWYIRRSRDRIKLSDDQAQSTLATLRYVVLTVTKLLAPFTPFISDHIYQQLGGTGDSVHLADWPAFDQSYYDATVLEQMALARQAVEKILALREHAGLKVRQPLTSATVPHSEQWSNELISVVAAEVNVQQIQPGADYQLDTVITPELAQQGMLRELVRQINALRKQQGLSIHDQVVLQYMTSDPVLQSIFSQQAELLQRSVLANRLEPATQLDAAAVELTVNQAKISVVLQR
ncbi:MAG: isoleucine--tRNA ligase [Candidatus Kerfeldbacteria bacterium]|nr:isoleucine--tRNA ligase [Candidatus Kerfeldbacteria bacterium]